MAITDNSAKLPYSRQELENMSNCVYLLLDLIVDKTTTQRAYISRSELQNLLLNALNLPTDNSALLSLLNGLIERWGLVKVKHGDGRYFSGGQLRADAHQTITNLLFSTTQSVQLPQ